MSVRIQRHNLGCIKNVTMSFSEGQTRMSAYSPDFLHNTLSGVLNVRQRFPLDDKSPRGSLRRRSSQGGHFFGNYIPDYTS